MNKMKRFLTASFAMVMIAGSTMVASAEESTFRGQKCLNCNIGTIRITTEYSPWVKTNIKRNCTHRPNGEDRKLTREKTTTQKCTTCGFGVTTHATEESWECHGYY